MVGLGRPDQTMGQDDPIGSGVAEASVEEQETYNRFVALSMMALYHQKSIDRHMDMIKNASSPEEGVAEVASQIAMRVFMRAKEDGLDIPSDVLLHGGKELVEQVAELAAAAGVADLDQNQVDMAYLSAAEKFGRNGRDTGLYSEAQGREDVVMLKQMADSGQLDAIMQQIAAAQNDGGA